MNNSTLYKQAQLPANALYVGIDPHKRQHTASVCTADGHIRAKFKVANGQAGFEELRQRCDRLRTEYGASGVLFAIEPGGHYWRTLAAYLMAHHYAFRLVNPFTLKRQRDGEDLTQRKNDFRDAAMAADLVRAGKYTWTTLPSDQYAELRYAHESYQHLVEEAARLKLHLTTALDQLFPEFQTVFKALDGQTALAVLGCCPDPQAIAAKTEDDFVKQVRAVCTAQRVQHAKLRHVHRLAQASVGLREGRAALTKRVQALARRLVFTRTQRHEAEVDLIQVFQQFEACAYLLSIPGLGLINAAGLLATIGDIGRFSSVKQLAKLAGITPIEHTSDTRRSRHTPMSKKGRRALRSVAYRAVISLVRHNEVFRAAAKRWQERSEHRLTRGEAIGATMNKLLRVIYALLTKRQTFDPQYRAA
jgi:transposase